MGAACAVRTIPTVDRSKVAASRKARSMVVCIVASLFNLFLGTHSPRHADVARMRRSYDDRPFHHTPASLTRPVIFGPLRKLCPAYWARDQACLGRQPFDDARNLRREGRGGAFRR